MWDCFGVAVDDVIGYLTNQRAVFPVSSNQRLVMKELVSHLLFMRNRIHQNFRGMDCERWNMSMNFYTICFVLCLSTAQQLSIGLPVFSSAPATCQSGYCDNGSCLNGSCLCDEGWIGERCQFCDGRFRWVPWHRAGKW